MLVVREEQLSRNDKVRRPVASRQEWPRVSATHGLVPSCLVLGGSVSCAQKLATLTHERRLAERLERLNLETIHIEGDGNCQFRTLAHELLGSQQFHQEIRDKVIAHIR